MPLAPALIDLIPLVMFAVALALCVLSLYLARALFGAAGGAVGWIPGIGGWIKGKIEDVAHKITSGLGHAATVLEARVGASWHSFARLWDWIGRELARHAALLERIANDLVTANFVDLLRLEVRGARRLIHYVEKQTAGIGRDTVIRIRQVERGIGADVLPRIRGIERRLDRVIEHDVASLRARDRALSREYDQLHRWLRSHPWTIVTGAFVGAVAVALQRIGASWIRCNNWRNIGKVGCSLEADALSGLLGALFTVEALANLRTLVKVAQEAEHGVAAGIKDLLDV